MNASEDDVVIFTGSGTTGAIHKLIHALKLEGDKAKKSVSKICMMFSTRSRKRTSSRIYLKKIKDLNYTNH